VNKDNTKDLSGGYACHDLPLRRRGDRRYSQSPGWDQEPVRIGENVYGVPYSTGCGFPGTSSPGGPRGWRMWGASRLRWRSRRRGRRRCAGEDVAGGHNRGLRLVWGWIWFRGPECLHLEVGELGRMYLCGGQPARGWGFFLWREGSETTRVMKMPSRVWRGLWISRFVRLRWPTSRCSFPPPLRWLKIAGALSSCSRKHQM